MSKVAVTVIILTFNEERHIGRCLDSIASFAQRVVVVDSFSTDGTCEIASVRGAEILRNKFVNQAVQFQWALDQLVIDTPWLMRLDADEIIGSDLAAEIAARLPVLGSEVVGVNLRRKHIFMGRWIRHGGRYPLDLIRIWRLGHGHVENRWMDEHVVVWGGGTVTFKGDFSDANLNDLGFFTTKHSNYATREAIEILNERYGLFARDRALVEAGKFSQASVKRLIKEHAYAHLPFFSGPVLYFIYRYVFQLGFLDGREGLIYHVLQGFWYRFLVEAKVCEFDRELRPLSSAAERRDRLEGLVGFRLG